MTEAYSASRFGSNDTLKNSHNLITHTTMKKLFLSLVAAAMMCAPATAQLKVKSLSTYTNKLQVEQLQASNQTVQINRTLYAGYNSICLPMSLTAESLQSAARDVRIERLAGIQQEGNTLCLYFVDCTADGIEAGMPYLIFSPTLQNLRVRSTDAKSISTDIHQVSLSDAQGNRITFGSSWESVKGDSQRYGIPAKQDKEVLESVLIRTDADKTFLPTRCGVNWNEQSPTATTIEIRHFASLRELPTGISTVATEQNGKAVYDLSGRRATTAKKGIYVVDGKKTAVK